jgi:TRAP-type C4-dicarboxylate transport system permease large subunit
VACQKNRAAGAAFGAIPATRITHNGGIFTPTEASPVGMLYGLITDVFFYRRVGVCDLGLDSIVFGPIMVINFVVGMETPPLGYSLFVGSAISGLSIEEIARGMLPFFLVDVGMLMVVTFVPWATLWLPKLIVG